MGKKRKCTDFRYFHVPSVHESFYSCIVLFKKLWLNFLFVFTKSFYQVLRKQRIFSQKFLAKTSQNLIFLTFGANTRSCTEMFLAKLLFILCFLQNGKSCFVSTLHLPFGNCTKSYFVLIVFQNFSCPRGDFVSLFIFLLPYPCVMLSI